MSTPGGMPLHRAFAANVRGRDFFCGDIHGSMAELTRALAHVHFNPADDRLFCVGDIIDRGEDSAACIHLCETGWFFSVLGNHEEMLLKVRQQQQPFDRWQRNGGGWWQHTPPDEQARLAHTLIQHLSLTLTVETAAGAIGVVHAGYPFSRWPLATADAVDTASVDTLLWDRTVLRQNLCRHVAGARLLISGHTVLPAPRLLGNHLFIDTGCGYSPDDEVSAPRLTLCEIVAGNTLRFYCADAPGDRTMPLP
ncbi:metallophosphoesterase [Pantoea sp. 1.19]|uniref:metallophosphoesterase n=1 Tax=Pantoea sp. 1.19 TaxID=1925589 RepID=UPI0009490546|nr:metallophosphoesterase [Pantoea sp. 1.19]